MRFHDGAADREPDTQPGSLGRVERIENVPGVARRDARAVVGHAHDDLAVSVVLHPDRHVPGVADSKAVPAPEREILYELIIRNAVAWATAEADPVEIDRINIHQASLRAMQRAILALAPLPDIVLVDAFRVPDLPMAQRGVPHGDRRCSAIAAASIVAKVTRDRQMLDLHRRDPRYGFDRHKGYATADHLDAVARFGYSDVHRRSFRPPTLFDTID